MKTKYRIIEEKEKSGTRFFYIQTKKYFFWTYLKKYYGDIANQRYFWDTFEAAKEYIEEIEKQKIKEKEEKIIERRIYKI